ncbi:MAG: carbamoyltransferase C-terminal domain-containing protein [Chloroflexota bacterium]
MKYILGLNSVYHESSVCLVGDGKVIAYAEEERFNRVKHAKFSKPENTDIQPWQSIDYCLDVAGIDGRAIDQIGFSFDPKKRLQNIGADAYPIEGMGYGTEFGEQQVQDQVATVPDQVRQYLKNPDLPFEWLDHHLCHAISATAISPYRESAVIVVDGIAEYDTISLSYAKDRQLHPIKRFTYPNSIGFLWEKIAQFLGFTKYDAGKIMGLAAYGDSTHTYPAYREFIDFNAEGEFAIDNQVLKIRSDDLGPLETVFGLSQRAAGESMVLAHANIAAGLQRLTEEAMLSLAEFLYHQIEPRTKNLCLAGGVALNCQANGKLAKQGLFEHIFIPPHCNDAGTSIGAALHLAQQETEIEPIPYFSPFWITKKTREEQTAEARTALEVSDFDYERPADLHTRVAALLNQGEIVANFHGTSEIGPRALGNRSILAAPDKFMVKEILNFKVKRREFFRPLAPVVLREHLTDYFEMPFNFSPALYYMLMTLKVRPDKLAEVHGVTHIDGTARVQVVDEHINPNLYRLMRTYYDLSGIPILLNTSFNHQEPVVHTPENALRTFGKIETLNYLVLDEYLVWKK